MKKSDSIKEIALALSKMQSEIKPANKDLSNPAFKSKYSDINSVWEALREPLTKNGLCAVQDVTNDDICVYVSTVVIHISGEWLEFGPFKVPVTKNNAHGIGSSTSYAKRYALCAALGITSSDEDDDGNACSQVQPVQQKPAKISKEQIQYFQDQLKFHGEPVASEFMGRLATKNVFKIEDMQAHWFEGAKKVLFELIEKYQGGDQDGE